jgi:membrane-associated phospholipid phosphatase
LSIRRAFTAHWQLKIALSLALTLFFCVPYFALQHLNPFPARRFALSTADEAIAFAPAWVWIYQSVYLLLSLVPWLAVSREELTRYARGFLLLSSTSFLFFLLFPIQGPRPEVSAANVMFRLLVSYDAPLNSFPSLHVGLSVYTVLVAARMFRGRLATPERVAAIALLSFWTAAIAYAALATKQHYAIDLPAGALLAYASHWIAWRPAPQPNLVLSPTVRFTRLEPGRKEREC